ncbi:MAG: LamG domain-containing protein [Deltaproteobacteria bacterium]|nr:LamG domain-containing protein [Candidatus Anaeroferrophillus wilburensis]MBN2889429.1 LamG domain-containing protein [Deltaproteobacteria bacterium]
MHGKNILLFFLLTFLVMVLSSVSSAAPPVSHLPLPDYHYAECLGTGADLPYVDLGNDALFNPGAGDWSVSVWFKWDGSGGDQVVYSKSGLYEAWVAGGTFYFRWSPAASDTPAFAVAVDQWTHAVITYDGNKFRAFKNGSLVGQYNDKGSMGTNGESLILAARAVGSGYGDIFSGQLDEFMLFSQALNPSQAGQLHTAQLAAGLCSSSAVDHFTLADEDDDRQALACRAELITIQAKDNADSLLTGYLGTTSISADNGGVWYDQLSGYVNDDPPAGSWSDNGSGTASYTFAAADNGQIKLWLRNSSIPAAGDSETVQIGVADGAALGSLAVDYYKAGFSFVWDDPGLTTQIAAKPSDQGWNAQAVFLQGVRVNPLTGACETLLQGTVDVEMRILYLDPAVGAEPLQVNGTGVDESWTAVELDFTDGEALLVFQYDDAGRLQWDVRYDSDGDGVYDMLGVNIPDLIVRPLGFEVFTTTNGWQAASSADSSVFVSAGAPFNLSARAVSWQSADDSNADGIADSGTDLSDNPVTGNYQAVGVAISHLLLEPAAGSAGSLGTTTLDFAGGLGTIANQTFSEVGIVAVTVSDSDYLSSGAGITGTSTPIGRFTPDHFAVQSTVATLAPACGVFTYLGQPFSYQDVPQITIAAQNLGNGETLNYSGDYCKLPAVLTPAYLNNVAGRTLTVTPASLPLAALSSQTLTVVDSFVYEREAVAPFAADFDLILTVADSDGILYGVDGTFSINTIIGTELRAGRLFLGDNFGPETEDISDSPLLVQYWDGTGWLVNPDDSCTNGIGFDSPRATVTSLPEVVMGQGQLTVTAPSPAAPETITICPLLPSWLSCSGTDCCGTFTFGIYRGNDRIIFKMETPE